jgi:hypothetical protein
MENMDAEGSSQAKKTTAETINNELAHKNYQKCGHDDSARKKDEETCNDVINLEHSESSSASGTESIEDNENEDEEFGVSYPRHYRQFTGNYSESDDFEVEDEEEAERHLAFKGEDDDTSEDDAIGTLSSQDEDDDEEDEDEEGEDEEEEDEEENSEEEEDEDWEEYGASSGGEESENNINETAEKLISKSENAEIEVEGRRENDEDIFSDGGMLRAAVHQFVIPSTAGKKTSALSFQTMDDQVRGNENKGAIKEQMGRHNEGRLVGGMVEVNAALIGNHSLGSSALKGNESAIIGNSLAPGAEDAKEEARMIRLIKRNVHTIKFYRRQFKRQYKIKTRLNRKMKKW